MKSLPKKNKKEIQKAIQLFLDVINIKDMGGLTEYRRAEIAGNLHPYLTYRNINDTSPHKAVDPELMKKSQVYIDPQRLSLFQNAIKSFFDSIILRFRERLDFIDEIPASAEADISHQMILGQRISLNYEVCIEKLIFDSEATKDGKFRNVANFIELIDGVPVSAFKKCKDEECEKWFVNLTQRNRKYCCNLCASKKNLRDKRAESKNRIDEGDPVAIKAYETEKMMARARASDWYDKRVAEKTPKAKITKRPRKPHSKAS